MTSLMYELAAFAQGDGKPIDSELRKKLPYLQFTFSKFAGEQGDVLLTRLFGGDKDVAPTLRSAAKKLESSPEMAPVGKLVVQLCDMAEENRLTGESLKDLAHLAGETGQVAGAEPILDPRRLSMSPIPSNALRRAFQQVLVRGPDLSTKERDTLELFVAATSNIEELLSFFFARYATGTAADRKKYLYLAWMLWAFLQIRSGRLGIRGQSIYKHLPRFGTNVITFNYTNFFDQAMSARVLFFHGRLDQFLRMDTRELVTNHQDLDSALDVDRVANFLGSLRLDVRESPAVDVPALVPPTSFKPLMSRQQLRTWVRADDLLQEAALVVIVGYSFGMADEHFNDLLRNGNPRARILVANPDQESARAACRVLGLPPDSLKATKRETLRLLVSNRLTWVDAGASDVTPELVDLALDDRRP